MKTINERFLNHLERIEKQFEMVFEDSSDTEGGHPTNTSSKREAKFREIVGRFLPSPCRTVNGVIFDRNEKQSHAADCIVLASNHPMLVEADTAFTSFVFAEGVSTVIELKTSLKYQPDYETNCEIISAFSQIEKTKALRRPTPILSAPRLGIHPSDEAIRYSETLPTYIFAKEIGDPHRLALYMSRYMEAKAVDVTNWPDLIIGLDGGGLSVPKYRELKPSAEDGTFLENTIYSFKTKHPLALLLYKMISEPSPNQLLAPPPFFQKYMADKWSALCFDFRLTIKEEQIEVKT